MREREGDGTVGERVIMAIGALAAVALQVFVAPHIGVLGGIPNFVVVWAVLVAVTRPSRFGPVLPFVLGLAFDLFSGGPVGAMAFSLTAFSMGTALFLEHMNNDTRFMSIVALALGLVLVELSYGVFLLLFGYNAGLLEAVAYRVVPCFLYDLVVGLILSPVAARFLKTNDMPLMGIAQLR